MKYDIIFLPSKMLIKLILHSYSLNGKLTFSSWKKMYFLNILQIPQWTLSKH